MIENLTKQAAPSSSAVKVAKLHEAVSSLEMYAEENPLFCLLTPQLTMLTEGRQFDCYSIVMRNPADSPGVNSGTSKIPKGNKNTNSLN